jgi:hypothetical protein
MRFVLMLMIVSTVVIPSTFSINDITFLKTSGQAIFWYTVSLYSFICLVFIAEMGCLLRGTGWSLNIICSLKGQLRIRTSLLCYHQTLKRLISIQTIRFYLFIYLLIYLFIHFSVNKFSSLLGHKVLRIQWSNF